jgi:uncharacterized membrane protein YtjA (UPF0391 family)
MLHGNTAVVFMVIAVVSCVLGLTFAGLYFLNKAVNESGRAG